MLIAACPSPAQELTQHELDASRNLWNANGFHDYDYFMQRSCFCLGDVNRPGLVQVRDGVVAGVTDSETLQPLDPQFFLTVDGLFDELQRAIDTGLSPSELSIQAEFDRVLGYPTSMWIDIHRIADDEMSYTARDLRPIPEPSTLTLAAMAMAGLLVRRRRVGPGEVSVRVMH